MSSSDGRPVLGVSVSRLIDAHYRARNPTAGREGFLELMRQVIERTAREQMQELCPNGWSARIIVYGEGAPLPDDIPSGDRRVCVE